MKIAPLAEHALTNVLLKQFLKAISTKLIRICAQTVVHAPMFARLRLFIQHNDAIRKDKGCTFVQLFFYPIFTFFSLKELVITETELKLMARAAIMGDNSIPKKGYNKPAAIGIPRVL